MEVICYVCNEKTSDWHRNLVETKSVHSNTPIIVFIDKFLDNHVSHRNMNDESNCICSDCLFRIYSYDWMCMNLKEQENELRTLIRKTEDTFITNHIKSEVEFINPVELDEEDCIDNQSDNLNTEDSLDGTEEIEIGQPMIMKTETPADNENDEGDEDENENEEEDEDDDDDIHKAKSVDALLVVSKSPTRNRPNRKRSRPKRYSDEDKRQSKMGLSSVPKIGTRSNGIQKRPHKNKSKNPKHKKKTSNDSENHQSEEEATQEEIEIDQAMVMKTEKLDGYDYNVKDVVENDIHKAKSVDAPLHLMVTESPTHTRTNRHRTRLKRYSNEHESRSQVASSKVPKRKKQTQKQPDQNETNNSTDNHRSEQQPAQSQKKFKCHQCGTGFSYKHNLKIHEQTRCAEMIKRYFCPLCDGTFTRPSTLRDHLESAHRKTVTLEYANDQGKFYRNTFNSKQKPKGNYEKFTCKCNTVISCGRSSFKRHVKRMHGHTNWKNQVKSREKIVNTH